MTRGMTLNNPLNLMEESTLNWQGEIKPTADPIHRLAQFGTILDGLRAGLMSLKNQQVMHGLCTWATIIPKYAPRSENDTGDYIDAICEATGVKENDHIDLTNIDFLTLSGKAIIRHEQGYDACNDADIHQAAIEALLPY